MSGVQHLREARWRKQEQAEQKRRRNVLGREGAALRDRWSPEQHEQEQQRIESEIQARLEMGEVTVYPPSNPWRNAG